MKVDLIIPFYNENQNLEILCKELSHTIPQLKHDYKVLFVDDGSTDNSFDIVKKNIKNLEYQILQRETNGGQTPSFESAFQIINSDYLIRMDSDLQDDPQDLYKFDEILDKNFDIILGFRGKRKHNIFLKILTYFFDRIVKFFSFSNLKSSSGSFICFKSKFFKKIRLKNNDHRYLTIIAQAKGAEKNICIDINHRSRKFGKSNYNSLTKILFGMFEIIGLYIRIKKKFYEK
jgi:glycosyltransferase involved in cell wall biosynthesis